MLCKTLRIASYHFRTQIRHTFNVDTIVLILGTQDVCSDILFAKVNFSTQKSKHWKKTKALNRSSKLFDKLTNAIIFNLLQAQNCYGLEEEKYWCGWRDLNPHASRRQNLNLVRLPISPHPLLKKYIVFLETVIKRILRIRELK